MALAALAALSAPSAWALDLAEAWAGARQHAPQATAAQAARDAGLARHEQSRALWRPTIGLEAGLSYAGAESSIRGAQFAAPGFGQSTGVSFDTSVTGGTGTRVDLVLRQPLISRERTAQGQALSLSAQAAEVQWAQAQQDLMLRTAQTYFEAAVAAEQVRLLQQQAQSVQRAATEARDRFQIGDKPITDVHEATARAAALQSELLAAQTRLAFNRQALSDLTGLAMGETGLSLPTSHAVATTTGSLDEWLARAEQHNPGLRLAATQVAVAQAKADASGAAFSPTLDAVARLGRERLSGDGDFGRASQTTRQQAIGVVLNVPLYTGGMRSAQHREGLALVEQARAEQEQLRQQVTLQTRDTWQQLQVAQARLDALDAALTASRARLDATQVGLQAGDRTTLDLLNAQNDARGAELALLQARVQRLMLRLQLASLAGALDEQTLNTANAQLTH
ncbi:MAG: TolC family outer membrane protein [Hydrogenophaga sp.]|nr:TolC family outer membrane protein [Hydrogenophaga sp.]